MEFDPGYICLQFSKKMNAFKNQEIKDEDIINIVYEIIKPKDYITYKEKCRLVEEVANKVVLIQDNKVIYDSRNKYYEFICAILSHYTTIKITDSAFDKLSETGILKYLLVCIHEEYELCVHLMELYFNDLENGRIKYE